MAYDYTFWSHYLLFPKTKYTKRIRRLHDLLHKDKCSAHRIMGTTHECGQGWQNRNLVVRRAHRCTVRRMRIPAPALHEERLGRPLRFFLTFPKSLVRTSRGKAGGLNDPLPASCDGGGSLGSSNYCQQLRRRRPSQIGKLRSTTTCHERLQLARHDL